MIDPKLDLLFERIVDVPAELVWRAWTEPEHLKHWFTPAPWRTSECEIDLRPGGLFRTVMRSPEGEEQRNLGCYLELVPNRKLVWTNALERGYRPRRDDGKLQFVFTATLLLEPHGSGTKYTAILMHRDEAGRDRHESLGFQAGWGEALEQLVAHVKSGAV